MKIRTTTQVEAVITPSGTSKFFIERNCETRKIVSAVEVRYADTFNPLNIPLISLDEESVNNYMDNVKISRRIEQC